MKAMTSNEIHRALRKALHQVSLRLEAGTLDHSGRYYPESEFGARRKTNKVRNGPSRKATARVRVRKSA